MWIYFVMFIVGSAWITLMVDYVLSKVHERHANLTLAMMKNNAEVYRGK